MGAESGLILGPELHTKRANITTAATTELVAAQTGKRIVVYGYKVVAGGAVGVKFISDGASDTDLDGKMNFAANGGITEHGTVRAPVMWTKKGEALSVVTDAAVAAGVGVQVRWYADEGTNLADPE